MKERRVGGKEREKPPKEFTLSKDTAGYRRWAQ